MNEYEIGLKFSDGNMPEQLAAIFRGADENDRKFNDLQNTLNRLGNTGAASLDKTAKAAQNAFNGQAVSNMNAELLKLAKTIDGAGGVADAVESLGKEYLQLKKSADILKTALKNTTDPKAIALYNESLKTLNKGIETLSKTAKTAGVNLKQVEKGADTGKQVFENFFGQLTKAGLIIAVVEAVIQFTKYAVGLSVAVDKSNKALEAYFQDANKAKQVTNELIALSEKKLLPLDDTLAAGKALAGYGIQADRIAATLGNIAEISAATGKDLNELSAIYGKARTSGVLYAEDINQLLDAGINIIPEFSRLLNVSASDVKKLASEGKISFETLQLAFANLAGEGGIYAGQIAKQTETLGGAFNSLVARFQPATKAIGDFFSEFARGAIEGTNLFIDQGIKVVNFVKNLRKTEDEIRSDRELENKREDDSERSAYENQIDFIEQLEKEFNDAQAKLNKENAAKAKAARDKAAKEEADREKQRIALRLSLIKDETEQLIAQTEQRGKEDEAKIKELFSKKGKLTAEGEDLLLKSREKTAAEIEKIQADQFTKEQEILAARLENEKQFTESYLKEQERRAVAQKDIGDTQIDIVEQQLDAYLLKLKAAGATEEEIKALQETFDLAIQKRRLNNELQFQQAILAATSEGDTERRKQIEAQIQLLQAEISNVQFQIDNPDPIKANRLIQAIDKIKKQITDALGIKPDELDGVIDSAIDSYDKIFSAIREITDLQIEQNDRLIDSVNEKITEQEKALEKEKKFAEEGKANNVKSEQEKLDALLKQQEDYEKKGQELRAKAARQQLIQDTISQVSNTVTAVAKIYSANAGIPAVGLILAAAQIAALFAGLAAARAKAKAAATEKLHTGGMLPFGKSDENGGTGYKIEGTNYEVGGGEYIVNRKVTQRNRPFLEKFNAGFYNGLDMSKVVADFQNRQQEKLAYYNASANNVDTLAFTRTGQTAVDIVQAIQSGNNQVLRYGFGPLHKQGQYFVDAEGNEVHVRTDAAGNQYRTKKVVINRSKRNGRTK